jgi:hypothetical protein
MVIVPGLRKRGETHRVSMTSQLQLSGPQLRSKRPLPNLLAEGFQLVLRNWPCVVWVYAVNLVFALLASVPFATGLSSYLDHTLAAQKIAGTIDIASIGELSLHVRDTGFYPMVMHTAGWVGLFQLLVLFFLFAGSLFVFVAAEPPQLSVLLRGGVAYFWRFVRAAFLAGGSAAIILCVLLALRAGLLARVDAVYVERRLFLYAAVSGGVVLLVALLLRLWWDLVEVYIVRNAMDGERRVHLALVPAFRLLFRHFFRIFGSFLLTGLAGVTALVLCLSLWKALPAHQVWIAALLAQLGLFLLLVSRFWQRGLEATLVMVVDPPVVITEELLPEEPLTTEMIAIMEGLAPAPPVGVPAALSEPTLRDLVAKLQTEPWANPDGLPAAPPRPFPEPGDPSVPLPAKPAEGNDPSGSLLDRHETKFPLGGVSPEIEADPATSGESEKVAPEAPPEPDKVPHSEKKPLP